MTRHTCTTAARLLHLNLDGSPCQSSGDVGLLSSSATDRCREEPRFRDTTAPPSPFFTHFPHLENQTPLDHSYVILLSHALHVCDKILLALDIPGPRPLLGLIDAMTEHGVKARIDGMDLVPQEVLLVI